MKRRWLATVVLGLAIGSPVVRERSWDSYPISSFPMFARADLGTRVALGHVALVDRTGKRRPADPALIGTPEPMVAMNVIERAIAEGRAADLCARVAARAPDDVSAIEVVTSIFDTTQYFSDPKPTTREVHASCNVSR
jgi:hypothetical protein